MFYFGFAVLLQDICAIKISVSQELHLVIQRHQSLTVFKACDAFVELVIEQSSRNEFPFRSLLCGKLYRCFDKRIHAFGGSHTRLAEAGILVNEQQYTIFFVCKVCGNVFQYLCDMLVLQILGDASISAAYLGSLPSEQDKTLCFGVITVFHQRLFHLILNALHILLDVVGTNDIFYRLYHLVDGGIVYLAFRTDKALLDGSSNFLFVILLG